MKHLILALLLSSCAHETTQLDRELALKLVDKLPTVTIHQTAPQQAPVIYLAPSNPNSLNGGEACVTIADRDANYRVIGYHQQCM